MREALYDVSMRVQTLRVMDQVYEQFTVGIRMTRQNNSRLGRAVEQTLSISTNVITVGLAIQAALFRERRVMAIYNESRRYMGDLIVANALQIKQHTAEIGEVYSQPVIAMEKITQAHEELKEAMEIAANLKQEGIESARENIKFLNAMSGDLHKSLTPADRNGFAGSIEA